jgi:hypothetical protein
MRILDLLQRVEIMPSASNGSFIGCKIREKELDGERPIRLRPIRTAKNFTHAAGAYSIAHNESVADDCFFHSLSIGITTRSSRNSLKNFFNKLVHDPFELRLIIFRKSLLGRGIHIQDPEHLSVPNHGNNEL